MVLVTVNYRLGSLGFGYLDRIVEGADTANLGLLDQIAALHWVRENIESFGDDPARVTVAGTSAGGAAVTALLAMPSSAGLFARASPQSGG